VKPHRPWAPGQTYLLPPSPRDWLPEGHLALFVWEIMDQLDLTAIERAMSLKDSRGTVPYSPRMMTALLLYGYATGVFSSRRIERATHEDVAFRVLAAGEHPHFTTVNEFRRVHRAPLSELFLQVLKLCRRAGLVKLGHVSLDGTKVQANASKHKAMSYERMGETERRLKAEIEGLLSRADAADAAEDTKIGVGQRDEDLPEELRRREVQREKIRAAREALEREAQEARAEVLRERAKAQHEKAEKASDEASRKRAEDRAAMNESQANELDPKPSGNDDDDEPPSKPSNDLPKHRVPHVPSGAPQPKAQRNFTDPDSRIMMRDGAFLQGYNAQAAVDETSQIIVAEAVTNQAPDAEHFAPMVARIIENVGCAPAVITADAGYFSANAVAVCEAQGIDAYVATSRKPPAESATSSEPRAAMRKKLATEHGSATYARRKAIVEPVFGQIKEARRFRRFSLRTLLGARFEWTWVCLTHNLLKLFRAQRRTALATA